RFVKGTPRGARLGGSNRLVETFLMFFEIVVHFFSVEDFLVGRASSNAARNFFGATMRHASMMRPSNILRSTVASCTTMPGQLSKCWGTEKTCGSSAERARRSSSEHLMARVLWSVRSWTKSLPLTKKAGAPNE